MKTHPFLRAESIAVILTILIGAVSLVYTFSTSFAKETRVEQINERINRVEDFVKSDMRELRLEMRAGFDKMDAKLDSMQTSKKSK